MTVALSETIVTVALSHTAEVQAWRLVATGEERKAVERLLRNLFELGHVAGYGFRHSGTLGQPELVDKLRSRFGSLTVNACLAAPVGRNTLLPSFLMPVWSFDHLVDDAPTATGRILGLDLELVATPSPDEELGANLPDRVGRWLIHARPLGA